MFAEVDEVIPSHCDLSKDRAEMDTFNVEVVTNEETAEQHEMFDVAEDVDETTSGTAKTTDETKDNGPHGCQDGWSTS